MKKLILITGVAGFIGSKVASRFIKEGFHVVGVDDLSNGKLKNIPTPMNMMRSAVRNPLDPQSPNFNPMLEGQLDLAKGGIDEGGLGWGVDDIGRFTSGPLKGQNKQSLFGTNNLAAQCQARWLGQCCIGASWLPSHFHTIV